jgi:hypothetical protein
MPLYQWRGIRGWCSRGAARGPAESAARALRGPGAMMAAGAAGPLRAGRWYPVAARAAGLGDEMDVVSDQCGWLAGLGRAADGRWRR